MLEPILVVLQETAVLFFRSFRPSSFFLLIQLFSEHLSKSVQRIKISICTATNRGKGGSDNNYLVGIRRLFIMGIIANVKIEITTKAHPIKPVPVFEVS